MRRVLVMGITLVACFILQTSLFDMIKLADVAPNILLILISSVAIMRGQKEGMILGFFAGLLIDIFYCRFLGCFAFLYMMFGFLDGLFHYIYYVDDNVLPLIIIGLNDFVYGLVMFVVAAVLRNHLDFLTYLTKIILPELVYTVAISLILHHILFKINRWIEQLEKGSADFV